MNRKDHYISVRGQARYAIKALTREDAILSAERRLEREIRKGRRSFPEELVEHWVGVAGIEVEPVPEGEEPPPETSLDLTWKNAPRGRWRKGNDKGVRQFTSKLEDFDE